MISGCRTSTTIVNVRQPEIMENFLRNQGEQLARNPGFTNGLMSTLIMGIDITPGDVYITNFLNYRPDQSDRRVAELWDRLVGGPGREAVYRVHPILEKH